MQNDIHNEKRMDSTWKWLAYVRDDCIEQMDHQCSRFRSYRLDYDWQLCKWHCRHKFQAYMDLRTFG